MDPLQPPTAASVSASHTLVGRGRELAALAGCLARLQAGQGALVLLEGAAGLGKTTLALACGARARDAGSRFAVGRCHERGAAPAFEPWDDVLDDVRAAGLATAGLPPPFGVGPAVQSAGELRQAVVTCLHGAARDRPLALLIDDAHWADSDTLELLELVTRRLERVALLVLLAYRPEELARATARPRPLDEWLPLLRRDRPGETLRLRELAASDVAELVEARRGPCSPELAAYLRARSDGNPLFLTELLRDLVERGQLRADAAGRLALPADTSHAPLPLPLPLRQVLRQRVDRLGEAARAVLDAAAVAGLEWRLPVVEAVLELDEAATLRGLEAALADGLIVEIDERTETYRFAHALLRDALYDGQLARRRKRLHAQLAAALEQLPTSERVQELPALALHHAAAEEWLPAARAGLAAGDIARDRFATHVALASYQAALIALRMQNAPDAPPSLEIELHEHLGSTLLTLRRQADAQNAFHAMLECARALDDRGAEGRALFWLSLLETRLYQPHASHATAAEALRVAEQVGEPRLRALAHCNLGHVHKVAGDYDAAETELHVAETLAREAGPGSEDALSWALANLAHVGWMRGAYRAAEAWASEALSLACLSNFALGIGLASWTLASAQIELGHYTAARRTLAAGLEHAERTDDPHYRIRLLNTTGWLYGELGDRVTARDFDQRALELSRSQADDGDRVAEAERYSLLNLATDALHGVPPDLAASAEYLKAVERMAGRGEYARDRYTNRYQLNHAELALARADPRAALRWVAEAQELAAHKVMRKNMLKCVVLHGRALAALDRPGEAAARLSEAVRDADALEHAALRWQARLWLAQALRAARQPSAAAETLAAARALVERIADELEEPDLRERFLASRLVGMTRAPIDARPAPVPAGLTARELEVLRLIARGATNAAIADQLSISVRTVDAHVTNILAKTAAPNRAAAAAFALKHGLG